jgi:hypothetical protein
MSIAAALIWDFLGRCMPGFSMTARDPERAALIKPPTAAERR